MGGGIDAASKAGDNCIPGLADIARHHRGKFGTADRRIA